MKPFIVIQRVRLPPGKGAACQPEARVAWRTAMCVVKRTQRVAKRPTEPRDKQRRCLRVRISGAAPGPPPLARRTGPTGVGERRKATGWITREPGRPGLVRVQHRWNGNGQRERSRPRPGAGPHLPRERTRNHPAGGHSCGHRKCDMVQYCAAPLKSSITCLPKSASGKRIRM